MKSTKAMRDRIRELMPKAWDDYDRAVDCVLEDLETSLVRIEALEGASTAVGGKLMALNAQWASVGGPFDDEWLVEVLAALAPEQDK